MSETVIERARCWWAGTDPLYVAYHDEEWGRPCHDDVALFERLTLEGFQAGLAWITILRKREGFERAFEGWDVRRIADYGATDVARLLADTGIVRNRLKVAAAITNAQAFLAVQGEHGTFDRYLWSFVGGAPLERNEPLQEKSEVPSVTAEAAALSKDLLRRGFRFVGPTIVYALMQNAGLVNDHVASCWLAPIATARTTESAGDPR